MNLPVLPFAVILGLIAAGALLWLFLSAAFLLWGARLAGIEKRSFGRAIGTILLGGLASLLLAAVLSAAPLVGTGAESLLWGGVLVGLAIPLSASLAGSTSALEIGMWGAACVALQLLIFRLVDLALHGLPKRIAEGEVAAAALLVGAKLATALIIASAMAG